MKWTWTRTAAREAVHASAGDWRWLPLLTPSSALQCNRRRDLAVLKAEADFSSVDFSEVVQEKDGIWSAEGETEEGLDARYVFLVSSRMCAALLLCTTLRCRKIAALC
jgi:hypothetical protein